MDYLNLYDIEAEPWAKGLNYANQVMLINQNIKTYTELKNLALSAHDYISLAQQLYKIKSNYEQLLKTIYHNYYGFLAGLFKPKHLIRKYNTLTRFLTRLQQESIWLLHRLALLLSAHKNHYQFPDNFQFNSNIEIILHKNLSSQDIQKLTDTYLDLKKVFNIKLNFLHPVPS